MVQQYDTMVNCVIHPCSLHSGQYFIPRQPRHVSQSRSSPLNTHLSFLTKSQHFSIQSSDTLRMLSQWSFRFDFLLLLISIQSHSTKVNNQLTAIMQNKDYNANHIINDLNIISLRQMSDRLFVIKKVSVFELYHIGFSNLFFLKSTFHFSIEINEKW